MKAVPVDTTRIRGAWQGRVTGCLLGKPVEVLSFREGRAGVHAYLEAAGALPLRDYVPVVAGSVVDRLGRTCCRDHIERAEADDDTTYTVDSTSTQPTSHEPGCACSPQVKPGRPNVPRMQRC